MMRSKAALLGTLIAPAPQFVLLFYILYKPQFGINDLYISLLNAALSTYGVIVFFVIPFHCIRHEKLAKLGYYLLVAIIGFIILTTALEVYTRLGWGWPLDPNEALDFGASAIVLLALAVIASPFLAVTVWLFLSITRSSKARHVTPPAAPAPPRSPP
jgi:hypothetical protein